MKGPVEALEKEAFRNLTAILTLPANQTGSRGIYGVGRATKRQRI
jgi:hypothetical protein